MLVFSQRKLWAGKCSGAAEAFMCTMAEADIENADKMLLNYQYNKFILKPNGKIQNWAPMFGDPIQGG